MKQQKNSSISRRRFLKTTAVFSALAAPAMIPSSAWSAQARALPGSRITLGFIGMGKQNQYLLDTFLKRDQTQVVAVCDVDTDRRVDAQERVEKHYAQQTNHGSFKGCDAYRDFRTLLDRRDIDAVVIATPDHWHSIPVIMAANAKKDIYCEKPLTLTIREGRAMTDAVRKNQIVFQTGSMQRSRDNFRYACELVRNGRIGKVQRVEVSVGGPSQWCDLEAQEPPAGLDWDFWLGPAPYRPYNEILSPRGVHNHYPHWRSYREYSGGGMTDWGAHHFDIAQWGLGMDESGPVEIIPPEQSEHQKLTYRYANGVEMLHTDGYGVVFIGTEGKVFVNRGKFKTEPESIGKEEIGPNEVHLYQSNDHKADWLQAIEKRARPICDVETGARTATVCHLGNLAYWYNRRLRWNPAEERFVNDAEANMYWLDIERRDPWQLPV